MYKNQTFWSTKCFILYYTTLYYYVTTPHPENNCLEKTVQIFVKKSVFVIRLTLRLHSVSVYYGVSNQN